MKYNRRKAQLNAISRSYTQKAQKEARQWLLDQGIDFDEYCKRYEWKASVTRFAQSVRDHSEKVMKNIEEMKNAVVA